MRKNLLTICMITFCTIGYTQKGITKIGIGPELNIPLGGYLKHEFNTGLGGYLNILRGISTAGQLTFTTGYSVFSDKFIEAPGYRNTYSMRSFLLGYRHSFSGFYIEPQAGLTVNKNKHKTPYMTVHNTEPLFAWAAGLGYEIRNIDIGIYYKNFYQDGSATKILGIHLGYNFSLNGRRK